MAGVFTCPHCGLKSEVADSMRGMSGPCARCGASITIGGNIDPPRVQAANSPVQASSGSRRTFVMLAIAVSVLALAVGGLWWGVHTLGHMFSAHMQRVQCANQMERIALALEAYHGEYSVYPPAYLADAQGKPMHSWRVLLLPYLDQESLYKQYRFDERWDGPHNSELAERMPMVYACPCDPGVYESHTSYLALVDPTTGAFAFPPPSATNTAKPVKTRVGTLLLEVSESGVGWLEPRDIDMGNPSSDLLKPERHLSYHVGRGNSLLNDGTTQQLSDAELRRVIAEKPPRAKPKQSGKPARSKAKQRNPQDGTALP